MNDTEEITAVEVDALENAKRRLSERLRRLGPFMPKPDQKQEQVEQRWTATRKLLGAALLASHQSKNE